MPSDKGQIRATLHFTTPPPIRYNFVRELCVALEHRWTPDAIFMLFTSYLDESDTHGPTPHMIMAGFLGTGRQWELFMRRLRKLQRDEGFDIFHATDFKHQAGDFEGWSDPKSLEFIKKLTSLVARELEQGITFDLTYERYMSEYRDTPPLKGITYDSQYGLCFRYCLSHLVNELVSTGKKHRLHVVLERGHPKAKNCEKIFHETNLTLIAKGIDVLGTFTLAGKKEAPPLMVADFLAHSYLLLRQAVALGKMSLDDDDELPQDYSLTQSKGLRYLGLDPNALVDLKRRLREDRWVRRAHAKRLKAEASAAKKASRE